MNTYFWCKIKTTSQDFVVSKSIKPPGKDHASTSIYFPLNIILKQESPLLKVEINEEFPVNF